MEFPAFKQDLDGCNHMGMFKGRVLFSLTYYYNNYAIYILYVFLQSGVAVLGWYTSQLIHFKLKQHCRLQETKCLPCLPENNLLSTIYPYVTDINKNDFYVDSISKIGKMFSDITPTVYLMANDQSESLTIKIKDNASGNLSTNVSENLSPNVSENRFVRVSENLSSNVSENLTDSVSQNLSRKLSEDLSEIVSENISSNVSENLSSNVSENISSNVSGKLSGNRSGNSAQTHPHSPTQSIDTSDGDLGGVLNSIENRLGLASIENGQYQDGLSLLR